MNGPQAWGIRAEADRRLVTSLTSEQRARLKALTTDANAWLDSSAARASETSIADLNMAQKPLRAAGERLVRKPQLRRELQPTTAQAEARKLRVYRGNLVLLAQRKRDALSNLRKFPKGSRDPMAQATRVELAHVIRSEAETRRKLAASPVVPPTHLQGRRLDSEPFDRSTLPDNSLPDRKPLDTPPTLSPNEQPVRILRNPDGTEWRIYRGDGVGRDFAYRIDLTRNGKPIGARSVDYAKGTVTSNLRRALAAQPRFQPWTEASIRHALHLSEGEPLDFKPDPERSDVEVAVVPDREGIVTEHRVIRRKMGDSYEYEVKSLRRVKAARS